MIQAKPPEVWLRGPLPALSPLLQPAAHTLLQAKDEVIELMKDFPDSLLWKKPAGCAAAAFHLQHLQGVLDRLFSYADGRMLTREQLAALEAEGKETVITVTELVTNFVKQVNEAVKYLETVEEKSITQRRAVGRGQLPSTLIGLVFHAAEHTMRHVGQLLVTVQVVKDGSGSN